MISTVPGIMNPNPTTNSSSLTIAFMNIRLICVLGRALIVAPIASFNLRINFLYSSPGFSYFKDELK